MRVATSAARFVRRPLCVQGKPRVSSALPPLNDMRPTFSWGFSLPGVTPAPPAAACPARAGYPPRVTWTRCAKIAFIGSHGIRKTTAAHAFAGTVQRAGRSVEFAREVVRDNPLGINE